MKTAAITIAAFMMTSAPAWALGGGRLAATQALNGLASEFSGPLAYSISLIGIVGTAVSWYRHHHDMGMLAQGGLGTLFVAGVALGGASLLGMIPGVTGALI
ncbi:MAG: TrbC/VirB2 family protein [Bryobacteraceae bacterium]